MWLAYNMAIILAGFNKRKTSVDTYLWTAPTKNVKNINKYAILDLIRFTPGGISRVEIARQMGLTRAAITSIISDLVNNGVVREAESRSVPSGRRPIVLEINPERGFVIGVDIGYSHVSIILADYSARVVKELESPFDITRGPEICLYEVDVLLRKLLDQAGISMDLAVAIGVGVQIGRAHV